MYDSDQPRKEEFEESTTIRAEVDELNMDAIRRYCNMMGYTLIVDVSEDGRAEVTANGRIPYLE